MTSKKLHPNVVKFKEFVKKYPNISKEVRKGNTSWQELYEDWYLLGEDDPRWEIFKSERVIDQTEEMNKEENKSDFMTQVFNYIKTMDLNQMQQHIDHVSQAIGAVQGVLSQFQATSQPIKPNQAKQPSHPFSFRKD